MDWSSIRARVPSAQAVLVLETQRGRREFVLGPSTQLGGPVPVLDWRTAPLAEVLFRHGAGERYELTIDERTHEGQVLARWLVSRGGLLGEERRLGADGEHALARPEPAPARARDHRELVVLDAEQQRAVELPANTSLVVDGEAGVGKTLVALYRVAALERRARARGRRWRALVLVPTEGLRRLVRLLAERLGLSGLEVAVFETWVTERGRAAFPGLPRRLSEGATAPVIALKRHPALRAVLDDFLTWKPARGVDNDERLPRSRMRLLQLFGDQPRLQRVLDAAGGALPARALAAVVQHTRLQFEATTEQRHRHVDADRLIAMDGRALDDGTTTHDADTFDLEDVAVLFELARRGALPAPALPGYDHVVLDEAQLRAPLELAMIGDAVTPDGTITLAGDHRQASDESAWFTGWEGTRAELRRTTWEKVTLTVSYRSVPAISELAREIVAVVSPNPRPSTRWRSEPPTDPAVWTTCCEHALAQAAQVCWHLDALMVRDPWRQICVLGRTPEHARRLHRELRGLDAALVLDGDFQFEPGVQVTTAAAVAGLEFDAVVLPDLSPSFYPATAELARTLYVATTRARDWLWLLTVEQWSPLLP